MIKQKFYPQTSIAKTSLDADYFKRFLDCDFNFKEIQHLKKFECVLVFGTGGSSLGGQTLDCFRQTEPIDRILSFMDNIDPLTFETIMDSYDPETTGLLVVSKSGETAETLMQMFTAIDLWDEKDWKKHLAVITEDKPSSLFNFAKKHKIPTLFHPKEIGGRYSIFTHVGMAIADLLELKPQDIHKGALAYLKNPSSTESVSFLKTHIDAGKTQIVMMPYSDRLSTLSLWFSQLWAESLGKGGKGTTPIAAKGTVDQHSQLQLYLDGPQDKIFRFLSLPKYEESIPITHPDAPKFLQNKTMADLFWAEEKATIETLIGKGFPVHVMEINDLYEETIGALLMHFITETVIMGNLMDVDPFDQPAVEEGKILAKKYLLEN